MLHCAQERIAKYSPRLSKKMREECARANSELCKELALVQLSDDEQINKSMIQMLVVFYEQGMLSEHRALLQDLPLIKAISPFIWNDTQIKLIPMFDKRQYDFELMQRILLNKIYYEAYAILQKFGLTQDFEEHFANPEKVRQLHYIDSVKNADAKALCLIFWLRANLSQDALKELVSVTKRYPKMATTLIDLSQKHTHSMDELHQLALNPLKHQQKTILFLFAKEFAQHQLNKIDYKTLHIDELSKLMDSFSVLKNTQINKSGFYAQALKNNQQGELLRIFLPGLAQVQSVADRTKLIELLYEGVYKGLMSQEKMLLTLKTTNLFPAAQQLCTRFACVKQMHDFGLPQKMIALAAQDKNERAERFRQIYMMVEKECKAVHERFLKSSGDGEKAGQWQDANEEYRKTLYHIAYEGITSSPKDLRAKIDKAEKKILAIVDPEKKSWLQRALIVIANVFIMLFTLTLANEFKKRNTGNYWFFTQTESGEKLRAQGNKVINIIENPATP